MNSDLMRRVELCAAWCGPAYLILLLLGWALIGGFLPMHAPSAGAEEIAAFFRENSGRIRLGMVLVMWSAMCFIPFSALIAHHVARFEAPRRTLTYTFVMAGFANAMLTFYPAIWWATNAFRAKERTADLIYLLNDAAWLQFLGGVSLVMPMWIIIALIAFSDKRPQPLFPRWVGYFNLWLFVTLIPDQMLFFFYDGMFAWNGLIAVWIPLTIFFIWFLVTFYYLRRAAGHAHDQAGVRGAPQEVLGHGARSSA